MQTKVLEVYEGPRVLVRLGGSQIVEFLGKLLCIANIYNLCVFALKEFNLKIEANNPVERTLKEEFAKNGKEIPI